MYVLIAATFEHLLCLRFKILLAFLLNVALMYSYALKTLLYATYIIANLVDHYSLHFTLKHQQLNSICKKSFATSKNASLNIRNFHARMLNL
jgi:hypothetical protein